jgi:outer membrane lipoprotein carrier protein
MKRSIVLVVPVLLALATAAQTQAPNVSSPADLQRLAAAVDRRYNTLQSLQADFSETYQGMGASRTESGTLWLKRPGKMCWQYRQPREKLFISNGKDAWFYVFGERQARKMPVKKLDDLRSPLRYLLGKTRLEKEFEGLSFAPDVKPLTPGDVVLRGVPKGLRERISQVLLEITPDKQISRIVIEEEDGSTTEFRFQHQKENIQVSDNRFRFTPPPGVETLEVNAAGVQ